MVNSRVTSNRLRRLTKRRLHKVDIRDQNAFNKWLASMKLSKNSQQEDLPSSQIPSKVSLIDSKMAQLFVVIDTCSIVSYRPQLMDFVVRLKEIHPKSSSPIRFIISLVVLEELDKCNRPARKRKGSPKVEQNNNLNNTNDVDSEGTTNSASTSDNNHHNDTRNRDLIDAMRLAASGKSTEPPRMFMRFVEEEMRTSEVLVSELDPFKKSKLGESGQRLEIINKDDRILECCLRSQSFIQSHAHHPETRVLLVTEDNVFKSKATTYGVVSYRWSEFQTKYKNFGLRNYVSTPMVVGGAAAAAAPAATERLAPKTVAYLRRRWKLKESVNKGVARRKLLLACLTEPIHRAKRLAKATKAEETIDEDVEIVKEVINLK